MSEYVADNFKAQRKVAIRVNRRRSRLARAALWCSLLAFVPLLGVAAMALSWLALRSMRRDASITGRKRAALAASLGLVVTAAQGLAGYQVYAAWRVLTHGPNDALRSGFAGHGEAFRDSFVGAGSFATSRNVADFLVALHERYGAFEGATMVQRDQFPLEPEFNVRYELRFEHATVPAVARVVFVQTEPVVAIANRMRFLQVLDESRGDLTFPKYANHEGVVVPADLSGEGEGPARVEGRGRGRPPSGASASGQSGSR